MIHLSFVLDQSDVPPDDEELSADQEQEILNELEKDRQKWEKECYQVYAQKKEGLQTVHLKYIVFPDTEPVEISLELNKSLFTQITKLYLYWGWPTIESIYKEVTSGKAGISLDAITFVKKTCEFLRWRIIYELTNIEVGASLLASKKWKNTIKTLIEWKAAFKQITKSQYVFTTSVGKSVVVKFNEYHTLRKQLERAKTFRSQAGAAATSYIPGENDNDHRDFYNTWGKNELEIRSKMKDKAQEIGKLCPAALFALSSSESIFNNKNVTTVQGKQLDHSYHESGLATEIMRIIGETITELNRKVKSLLLDGVSESFILKNGLPEAVKSKRPSDGEKLFGVERLVAGKCLENWNIGETAVKVLTLELTQFEAAALWFVNQKEQNTVLGHFDILQEYKRNIILNKRLSFQRCVLTHYIQALDSEINIHEFKSKKFDAVMKAIRWIASIVSIVAVAVAIVASDGAALPEGISLICSIIGTVDKAINITLLALMALEFKFKDEINKQEWQSAIAELNTKDEDTIQKVGTTLLRLHTERVEITKQLVTMLIIAQTIKYTDNILEWYGISTKLNLIARAVELDGLADDLDTVIVDLPVVLETVSN